MSSADTICLFDVDGTLTKPRQKITQDVADFLIELKKKVVVGLVGGSDITKIAEQMAGSIDEVTARYTYVFSENGLVAHKNGSLLHRGSIAEYMGEEKLQEFINYTLKRLSEISLPCKRGTFIEFRSGLINVSPIGRSCSQAERDQFFAYDKEHGIRESLVKEFKEKFSDAGLYFSIGGQISIDVFPEGWDKRYCLRYLKEDGFKNIHFFGDRTSPGGNDHEIFADPSTVGHTVTSPADTIDQVTKLFP